MSQLPAAKTMDNHHNPGCRDFSLALCYQLLLWEGPKLRILAARILISPFSAAGTIRNVLSEVVTNHRCVSFLKLWI